MKRIEPYSEYTATTLSGLEPVLAAELSALGAEKVTILSRAVRFNGSKRLLYRTNYESRLALRILLPLYEFYAETTPVFYQNVNSIPWENIFKVSQTFAIEAVGSHPAFTNTLFAAQKCKDAIVDRFRKIYEQRPSVNLDNPDLRIHLYLSKDNIIISLDSSGEPLFKRGYRKASVPAPLNEVLAAGLIRLSAWDMGRPLYDPFCGSGTIPIEAAMIATRTPAGKFRNDWGIMRWDDFDAELWTGVKSEADAAIRAPLGKITASDIDPLSLRACRKNLESSGFTELIGCELSSFEQFPFPETPGIIIANPPYGERLRPFDLISFYKMIGNTLKKNCAGYDAWIIASEPEAVKFVGLKPDSKNIVFNGPLECRFLHFRLFKGSRKDMLSENRGK